MITITSTESAKIKFRGTNVEISSVIARVWFSAPASGKTLQARLDVYESQATYENDPYNLLDIDGFNVGQFEYDLSNGDDPETWKPQTIQVAHDEVKAYLEGLGFTVVISGI